jgi:hypothetical protein
MRKMPPPTNDIRLPQAGDVYVFTHEAVTEASRLECNFYHKGDTLTLLEPTGLAPWDVISHEGHNWLVKCKYYAPPQSKAVWSAIVWGIDEGWLELVSHE